MQRSGANARYLDGLQLERTPEWYEPEAEWKARQIRLFLESQSISPESVCDVGCGTGGVLDHLRDGYPSARLVGFEVSPQALGLAGSDRKERVDLVEGDFLASEEYFDLLLLLDVFEHVEDYLGFLRALRCRAKLFLFHIPLELSVQTILRPASFAKARDVLGHLHYFSRETAVATLHHAGYEIVAERFTKPRIEQGAPTPEARFAKIPRLLGYKISPPLAARILGGFELLVMARAVDPTSSVLSAE